MTQPALAPKDRRTAMILSGGGARGAYEVGVLWYIFDDLVRLRGAPPKIDILCGTSVGAINACYLAAHLADPTLGLRRLVELWSELHLTRVLGFGLRQVVSLPRLLMGGAQEGTGLFDVRPMADLVQREISWRAVARCLRRRQLRALSISCTEVSTGRTVVFMQTSPDAVIPSTSPPRTLFRADHIGPHHALASAAIPLLFPPVRIDHELYLDGGLRQNTPIAPALRLGATHIFAVGSSREVKGVVAHEGHLPHMYSPGMAFLLGKILNAFLLDHIDVDIELLTRLNHVLADGTHAYGPEFTDRMSAEAQRRGAPSYRYVNCLTVRPSDDIGRLATEHVRRGRFRGDPIVTKRLLTLLDFGAGTEADLASYLLFDGAFCRQLMEMGRADAKARRDDLLAFFGEASDDPTREEDPKDLEASADWDITRRSIKIPLGT
jgi:NTE family protein